MCQPEEPHLGHPGCNPRLEAAGLGRMLTTWQAVPCYFRIAEDSNSHAAAASSGRAGCNSQVEAEIADKLRAGKVRHG